MEKTPRLRPHERHAGVNPHIAEYAGRLGAQPSRPITQPIRIDDPARKLGAIPMSITDGVPIPREVPPEEPTYGPGWPE